jgi:hypothetical protein
MDDIVRRKIRGRQVCVQGPIGRYSSNWGEAKKGHPVGYKHRSIGRVPKSHRSSRVLQDQIEETMKRQIAAEPAGPQRDFLIRDYEMWVANGKPTAIDQRMPEKQMEMQKTWQKGKPLSSELEDMDREAAEMRARRLLNLERL